MNRRALSLAPILWILAYGALAEDSEESYDRANRSGNQLILRTQPVDIQPIAEQYGLTVVVQSDAGDGHMSVVEGPEQMTAEQIEALIDGDPRVEEKEPIRLAALPALEAGVAPDTSTTLAELSRSGNYQTPCLNQWSGYADQEAARLIRVEEAHGYGCGSATIAVIDTGVDPDHPALSGALVPGYDFLTGRQGLPSEWDFLGGSLQPILEGSLQPILEGSLQPILEQSTATIVLGQGELTMLDASVAPILDPEAAGALEGEFLPPYFGHGTMVAGLIRLTAPGATIMPLRVFDSMGTANVFDIIRAIYYAVDHGADVINMSFSIPEPSLALRRAIRYARRNGVICVVAAGNQGEATPTYPAAFPASVGVAATDLEDQLSDFSNFGSPLVDLAAPGSGIISTFPGGTFGAGWGTSFSAPLVAGTLALIHYEHDGDIEALQDSVRDLKKGSQRIQELIGLIGRGRLDVLGTVLEAD